METVSKINVNEVKQILDNSTWDFEYSGNSGRDVEKATSYLDSQKFSVTKIKEALELLDMEDINDNQEAAEMVADRLAWDRISRFTHSYKNSNGWSVDESVSFKIY